MKLCSTGQLAFSWLPRWVVFQVYLSRALGGVTTAADSQGLHVLETGNRRLYITVQTFSHLSFCRTKRESSGGYGTRSKDADYGEKEPTAPRKQPKKDTKKRDSKKDSKRGKKDTKVSRGGYGYPHNGDYGEDGSMGPYGNTGGLYGGAYAGGYGGYGTYGAYTGEDGPLIYDINAEGAPAALIFGPVVGSLLSSEQVLSGIRDA